MAAGDGLAVASEAAIEYLRWSLVAEVGPILFGRLIERFGSARAAMAAGVRQLEGVEGIGRMTAETMAHSRDGVDVSAELALAAEHGVRVLCREDEEYPPALKQIPDAPICLYIRGRIERADAVALGVVGSRRCTIYGREQARRFGYALANRGLTIISGLARGIDGEAHKGALEAGGRTIAVLGNGLATVYPPEHRELAERITRCGAIVSELPMTASPESKNFLPRNRIIAGMSLGVLVVEAARRSGSLKTAGLATEYNREVYALPGRIDSEFSVGTNGLIRDQHAKLVMTPDDVIDELGEVGDALRKIAPDAAEEGSPSPLAAEAVQASLNDDERAVLKAMDHEAQSLEALSHATERPPGKVASTLLSLQLKGLVRQLPGNLFVRAGRKA